MAEQLQTRYVRNILIEQLKDDIDIDTINQQIRIL